MDDLSYPVPFADVGGGNVDYSQMNKGVTPVFYKIPVKDERASEKEGVARFTDMEVVMIRVAGDMNSAATSPVDDGIRERFSAEYERWQRTQRNDHVDGTPIAEWPLLSRTQVAEMRAAGIMSVEHLAGLSDTNVVKVPDGRVMRAKALAWLEAARNGGDSARLAAENERMRADMDELRKTIAEQGMRIEAMAQDDDGEPERRGPGRPRKLAA